MSAKDDNSLGDILKDLFNTAGNGEKKKDDEQKEVHRIRSLCYSSNKENKMSPYTDDEGLWIPTSFHTRTGHEIYYLLLPRDLIAKTIMESPELKDYIKDIIHQELKQINHRSK